MGFIILSDKVVRLINAMETVPRNIMHFYHAIYVTKQHLRIRL